MGWKGKRGLVAWGGVLVVMGEGDGEGVGLEGVGGLSDLKLLDKR
jgi:hypothetical protein